MPEKFELHREDMDNYLKFVAKEYRKAVGKKIPAEIILVGGASILLNYNFRTSTTDIDATVEAASAIKDAIIRTRNEFDLPPDWLNTDFMFTDSYSPRLSQYSTFYKTFANVLNVRTITREYLVAMKLRAGRQYKSDLSDVAGIIAEENEKGTPITFEQVQKAAIDLYGSWECIPKDFQELLKNILSDTSNTAFKEIAKDEAHNKQLLKAYLQDNTVMPNANINEILASLKDNAGK